MPVEIASAFIIPPHGNWEQGDVVEGVYFPAADDDLPAVLVTPACDLQHGNVSLLTFVALFPDVEVARQIVAPHLPDWGVEVDAAGLAHVNNSQRKSLQKELRHLTKHRFQRFHWLPIAIGDCAAHVADFSWVTSLPSAEVTDAATRIASMRSSWKEQLAARYVAFMGRVGTEDFISVEVESHIERMLTGVTVVD